MDLPTPQSSSDNDSSLELNPEVFKDKVLGALVGSAIGDAMGASTEMWDRHDIQKQYGYITGLTDAIRPKSAEGIWQHNMGAGATTDDTRWKYLMAQYFKIPEKDRSAKKFAAFITDYYQNLVKDLPKNNALESTDALDEELEKINWIKEWARVAMVHGDDDEKFAIAQNRFYGGEMSCAGMLYTPMFGLVAENASQAYTKAFEHAIFDIGYARDISSLVAVMTFEAMANDNLDSIVFKTMLQDPHHFKDSRLIGRLSQNLTDEAIAMVTDEAHDLESNIDNETNEKPNHYPGTELEWLRQKVIYDGLASKQKAIAFHAGEIWQILIAGLTFGEGDFLKTVQFIVNYGRDNDTVAAVAGMILGANIGYSNLPQDIRDQVVIVSRDVMGIDLEQAANDIIIQLVSDRDNKR